MKGIFTDREKTIAVYREWIEEVKRTVPADRLLVYQVKEGWDPLCDFLGVPMPEGKPFPRVNERKSFRRLIRLLRVMNWLAPALILIFILYFIIFHTDLHR